MLGRRIKIWDGRNIHSGEVQGRSGCVKEASGRDALSLRELKANIFKLEDLQASEVGTKLDKPHGRDQRLFLVSGEFVDALAP